MRLPLLALSIVLAGLAGTSQAEAALITAAGCGPGEVQAAIDRAFDGDIVLIPNGVCVWTGGVTITGKGITIQGGGSGRIIGRSTTAVQVSDGIKTITTQAGLKLTEGQMVRVSQTGNRGRFMEGSVVSYTDTTLTVNVTTVGGGGSAHLWLISTAPGTVLVNNAREATLFTIFESTARSVRFNGVKAAAGTGAGHVIELFRTDGGQPVIIQNCWFEAPNPSGSGSDDLIRSNSNRGVIANCSFDASPFSNSSLAIQLKDDKTPDSWLAPSTMGTADTTGTHNTYIEDCDFHAWLNAIDFDDNSRAVVRYNLFNNAALGSHGADTSNYGGRHYEVYNNSFVFNGYADGSTFNLNWWFLLRGGTGVITDNAFDDIQSVDYGDKAEFYMTVMNLQRESGPNPCWHGGYPAPRQLGLGRVTGTAGQDSITYKGDPEPLYIWNNAGTHERGLFDYTPNQCGAGAHTTATYLVPGRDFFDDGTAKPGYTKYAYPHPLRNGPSAPQNLRIVR